MTYDADALYDEDEELFDDDTVVVDGHLYEGALFDELDVDENRHEPILKTVVLLIALAMLCLGWRTHCRSEAKDAGDGTGRSHGGSSSGGRHAPLPLDVGEEDTFGHDGVASGPSPSDLHDIHRRSFDRSKPQAGWTLDIFSLAASRLAL